MLEKLVGLDMKDQLIPDLVLMALQQILCLRLPIVTDYLLCIYARHRVQTYLLLGVIRFLSRSNLKLDRRFTVDVRAPSLSVLSIVNCQLYLETFVF